MISITQTTSAAQLPVEELQTDIETYLEPVLAQLPDKRLKVVSVLMILGILAGQSPLMMQMARGMRDGSEYVTGLARRMYRFIWNRRFTSQALQAGLYTIGQTVVARYQPEALIVAIDPVNFEKPYSHDLEGLSTVYKSTPPPLHGRGRLTRGYPSLTACIVNLPEPVVT